MRGRPPGRRRARPDPDAALDPLEAGRRTTDPATKKRIAELARQVAAGEYDAKKRIREVFGMSTPSKERKR